VNGTNNVRDRTAGFAVTMATVLGSLASAAAVQTLLRVPGESPGIPAYARLETPFAVHTDEWAAIVFYRLPGCIPSSFNLLNFFDVPGAFACPLTVSGFEIWENAPGTDGAPRQALSSGFAVPVWLVRWPTLQAELADNTLTISELASLQPLQGIATSYHEVLHPASPPGTTGGAKVPHITISASGNLSDGRSFRLIFNHNERMPVPVVSITVR
jgi:hypothetical protein